MFDDIGTRMKTNYEDVYRIKLTRRMPVIIRIDMRTGHTFTKGFKKPNDKIFSQAMINTAVKLCEDIQNVQLAYIQSDEISLLLIDYKKLTSSQWFDGNIQKMTSVSASIATIGFNTAYMREILNTELTNEEHIMYSAKINKMTFDSRVFNIPESEVTNYFIWRQLDATRNAIQSLGQSYFSHSELQNKNCDEIQDMLFTQKNINFNDCLTSFKRGTCIIKDIENGPWMIDYNIPVFTQDRNYIEKYLIIADDH